MLLLFVYLDVIDFMYLHFQINRPYNLQCFLNENMVFTDIVKFEYQPQDNDSVSCQFMIFMCFGLCVPAAIMSVNQHYRNLVGSKCEAKVIVWTVCELSTVLLTILVKSIGNTNINTLAENYRQYQYRYCCRKVLPIPIPILLQAIPVSYTHLTLPTKRIV